MPKIQFFAEDISFDVKQKRKVRHWIGITAHNEGAKIKEVNYIFCSDEYLKDLNIEHLDHHYYTDIITFDNSEEKNTLEGDIFISIDRVKENSQEFSKSFEDELHRVMIHGILHLLGYSDKEEEDVIVMRQKENEAINLLHTIQNE
jgi:probable rRNA maturation factor